jgi:ABC-2 type transport system permease protein
MPAMRAFWKLTVTEFKLFVREPLAVFFILAFPLLLLWLNGSLFGNAPDAEQGGQGAVDLLVPGYVALILATVGFTQLPGVLATYRERGILRRLATTPVAPAKVLGAQLVVHLAAASVGVALLLAAATVFYDLSPPRAIAAAVLVYLAGALALYALGFVLAALAPNARTANAVGFVVYFPMIFLCGAVIPREALAASMRRVGEVLPLGPVVTGLQDAWSGARISVAALATLTAMVVVASAVGVRVFRWE